MTLGWILSKNVVWEEGAQNWLRFVSSDELWYQLC